VHIYIGSGREREREREREGGRERERERFCATPTRSNRDPKIKVGAILGMSLSSLRAQKEQQLQWTRLQIGGTGQTRGCSTRFNLLFIFAWIGRGVVFRAWAISPYLAIHWLSTPRSRMLAYTRAQLIKHLRIRRTFQCVIICWEILRGLIWRRVHFFYKVAYKKAPKNTSMSEA